MTHHEILAAQLNLTVEQIGATETLLNEGATVPFIARYRKEATHNMDEVAITAVRDGLKRLAELDARKQAIRQSLIERELMTDQLEQQIDQASTMTTLEDLYLPYRPKRRTRAMIAKEKGLEPLAQWILNESDGSVEEEAQKYCNETVTTVQDALSGAQDIIAETISEDSSTRSMLRDVFARFAFFQTQATKNATENPEAQHYRVFFQGRDLARHVEGHKVLGALRAEREGWITVTIRPNEDYALSVLCKKWVHQQTPSSEQIKLAIADGYKRLLRPAMETELRNALKERADHEAIGIFARNLRQLLMASPLGPKSVLAVDPGVRTGCKIVMLADTGALLHHDVIFLHRENLLPAAKKLILDLIQQYQPEAIAVGNGTASRETVEFINSLNTGIPLYTVNESGASVYSASDLARKEMPDQDVTVRGAVSIGRRLMDPLAELVKIDPKSIGVGQYQHDVDQKQLALSLDDTVMSCVNAVGVNLNTASPRLLSYVSGLNSALAEGIVTYREANGPFTNRESLKKVPRVGPKTFQQAAGFLRVPESDNPLDNTAVHPERYKLVEKMAADQNLSINDLIRDHQAQSTINIQQYFDDITGEETLKDLLAELAKPGRDIRGPLTQFEFDPNVKSVDDLKEGMILNGLVTNVTAFGAFVDVGAHRDGLIHKDRLVKAKIAPETLAPGQQVKVRVSRIDRQLNRIALDWVKN